MVVFVTGLPEHLRTVETTVVFLPCVCKSVEEQLAGVPEALHAELASEGLVGFVLVHTVCFQLVHCHEGKTTVYTRVCASVVR